MDFIQFLRDFFSNRGPRLDRALNDLESKMENEPMLKFQIIQVSEVLERFVKQKLANNKQYLSILGGSGSGKTYFTIQFLVPFFRTLEYVSSSDVYKVSCRKLVQLDPEYFEIAEFSEENLDKVDETLNKIESNTTVIIDNLKKYSFIPDQIIRHIQLLNLKKEHHKTEFVLLGSQKEIDEIRAKEDLIMFPVDLEINLPTPSLNQMATMFVDYARSKGFLVDENIIPTIKYYFRVRKNLSSSSQRLFSKKRIRSDQLIQFHNASEFKRLLDSVQEFNYSVIDISAVKNSRVFLESIEKLDEFGQL